MLSKSELNRKKLNKDINMMVRVITQSFEGSLISIILYGSYGRDEGAFYASGKSINVYNDYDVLLVVSKKLPSDKIQKVKKKLLDFLR